jgi:ribosomal protein L22
MSPAPRKKKDDAAPTAAEVEAKASEEAAESVPKGDDEPTADEVGRGDERSEAGVEETPAAAVEESAEEAKPKAPARKPRKKAAPKAAKPGDEKAEEKAEEKADEEPKAEKKPRKKAEPKAEKAEKAEPKAEKAEDKSAKPARKRDQPRSQRDNGDAAVLVRAQARYVRTSARKARLVCDHIRGKDVEQARAILSFTPRGAAKPWLKLLESAIANAEHNHELVGDELKIASIHADEGPTLKRYRPRAMGRATRIRKRTSHLTITLTPKE